MKKPTEEDQEFIDRDHQGLRKVKKDAPQDDARATQKAQAMYMSMFFVKIPMVQLVLSVGTYLLLAYVLGQKELLNAKFEFLHAWDLGWVYLALWIIAQTRFRLGVNANAARAGARLDRPDQHIYKVMDPTAKKDAPYVLMANTGAAGRFNRAQRGVFNTDEGMPLFAVNTMLAGGVFGPLVIAPCLLSAYGRIKFGLGYTEDKNKRGAGFFPAIIGECWMGGLVFFIAIKALAGDKIPF